MREPISPTSSLTEERLQLEKESLILERARLRALQEECLRAKSSFSRGIRVVWCVCAVLVLALFFALGYRCGLMRASERMVRARPAPRILSAPVTNRTSVAERGLTNQSFQVMVIQ